MQEQPTDIFVILESFDEKKESDKRFVRLPDFNLVIKIFCFIFREYPLID